MFNAKEYKKNLELLYNLIGLHRLPKNPVRYLLFIHCYSSDTTNYKRMAYIYIYNYEGDSMSNRICSFIHCM